ncbi:MAG: ThiF family adenylyltransferase [Thermoguttaceae bacterium]|jgi:adenylyltransferase/sulfurtransferase
MPLDPSSLPGRYARQVRYQPLGEEGQKRLAEGRAVVCGCGATGSVLANTLARAGVGTMRLVDRDFVEIGNLHRQVLFDEEDAAAGLPKAIAAAEKLRKINSSVAIEPVVADITAANIEQLCQGADVLLDGTDNFETRFLMNDAAVHLGVPWVYAGCVGTEGQTMTILPGTTPCLRCLLPECPPPGSTPTCDTMGVLGPIVGVIASLAAVEAIKILSGNRQAVSRDLVVVDLWRNRLARIELGSLREDSDCPACKRREFSWLAGRQGSRAAVLCGRNAVQLTYPDRPFSLDELARRLEGVGRITRNPFLLRLAVERYELNLFPDGRAIITGTSDLAEARTVYAKYVGN